MDEVKTTLDKAVTTLAGISGVEAIVLGGSRARETHAQTSDIDIGVYYGRTAFDLVALNRAAQLLDDEHRENLMVPPGAWGDWVNGGGWLITNGYHVDLILRDVERVEDVAAECREGSLSTHYQTGRPHAYINSMCMGELIICKILWDKQGRVLARKSVAEQYPPKLKKAIVGFFGFEAGFSCMLAESSATKDDAYYVTAHTVRAVSTLDQILFVINGQYCINEKKAISMINHLHVHPIGCKEKVNSIFATAGADSTNACSQLRELINEVNGLVPIHEQYPVHPFRPDDTADGARSRFAPSFSRGRVYFMHTPKAVFLSQWLTSLNLRTDRVPRLAGGETAVKCLWACQKGSLFPIRASCVLLSY